MDAVENEKEQLEQIKKWIQENGISIVMGIVIGLGGVYGWRWWQDYRVEQSQLLSLRVNEVVEQINSKQYEAAALAANTIAVDSPRTVYGQMAVLLAARARVEQGLLEEAATTLNQFLADYPESNLAHTAKIRLARVYLALSRLDDASALIPMSPPPAHARDYEELRGDIAREKGDIGAARISYEAALAASRLNDDIEFLQMKLDNLASLGESAEKVEK